MYKTKQCIVCGDDFTPRSGIAKVCGPVCRKGKEKMYNKEYKASHDVGRTPRDRYHVHKGHAKARGIEWLFTFETWWKMWEPHWLLRSNSHGGGLVMCRTGDKGPYSPDNCRIDTLRNNALEARGALVLEAQDQLVLSTG